MTSSSSPAPTSARSIMGAPREQREALAELQAQLTHLYTQIEQLVASLAR